MLAKLSRVSSHPESDGGRIPPPMFPIFKDVGGQKRSRSASKPNLKSLSFCAVQEAYPSLRPPICCLIVGLFIAACGLTCIVLTYVISDLSNSTDDVTIPLACGLVLFCGGFFSSLAAAARFCVKRRRLEEREEERRRKGESGRSEEQERETRLKKNALVDPVMWRAVTSVKFRACEENWGEGVGERAVTSNTTVLFPARRCSYEMVA